MQVFKDQLDFERSFAQFKRDVKKEDVSYETEQSVKDKFRDRALELLKYIIEDKYGKLETIHAVRDNDMFYNRDNCGEFILNNIKYAVNFWWNYKHVTITVVESEPDRWNRICGKDKDFIFEIGMFRKRNLPVPRKFSKGDPVLYHNVIKYVYDFSYNSKRIDYRITDKPGMLSGWDYLSECYLKSLKGGV